MPLCKKCGTSFSTTLKVNNKIKNLHSRKYCLECSPFGKHNTRDLTKSSTRKKRICMICNKEHTYTTYYCAGCQTGIRRAALKLAAIKYKGGQCEHCGYEGPSTVFDFHHVDRETKDFNISLMGTIEPWRMKAELDKCILLCANCHRIVERNAKRINFEEYAAQRDYDFATIEPKSKIKNNICSCGNIKNKLAKMCRNCSSKINGEKKRKVAWPSKEELSNMLWERPTTEIAVELGVSDSAVASWAKFYNITKPPRGYWAKVAAKK